MKNNLRLFVNKYANIRSLPMVYVQLTEVINDPRASIEDISKILSYDSGLTARMLRLANSALYSFPNKIDTISRALVVIGTRELHKLAFGTSVVTLFQGIPEDVVDMESFWKHSVACGIIAKILATYRNESNVERFFIAGLIHDIGRLVIFESLPNKSQFALKKANKNNELLFKVEREVIGFDHAEVGSAMLEKWNIPVNLREIVAYHHTPGVSDRYVNDIAIIHVADIIAHAMEFGSNGEKFVPILHDAAWKSIGLDPGLLNPTLEQTKVQLKEVLNSLFPDQKNE